MRASGILMPIYSIPSKYGIGCFSKEAYVFVDQLKKSKQSYWQILPIGPTSYGDSPYQSFSAFAGNPYFIDLETLVEEGLLEKAECDACDFGDNSRTIEYGKIYKARFELLKKAHERSAIEHDRGFKSYTIRNEFWLKDYALYMAIKNYFGDVSWSQWDQDIKLRSSSALLKYKKKLKKEVEFYEFIQYTFSKQWAKLKSYANHNGVEIIGDMPIYVAFDSADCWAHSELLEFDEFKNPIEVAGCPPDGFSATGQLWGNPVYNWEYHKSTDYAWWVSRISYSFELYDVVRVDHFRGFDEYYAIPFGASTAENGLWKKGPGLDLFDKLTYNIGDMNIIAEDLGFLTDNVRKLVKDTGFPGMKVLEFAFDSREESDYLPHNYECNSVVYTGTHDNDTIKGWYKNISEKDKELAIQYMNNKKTCFKDIHWDFICLALRSVSRIAIIPIQDYLGLGTEARTNIPSTIGGNWRWRLLESEITEELLQKIARLTTIYGRI